MLGNRKGSRVAAITVCKTNEDSVIVFYHSVLKKGEKLCNKAVFDEK